MKEISEIYVLDTSALLAFIGNEAGADAVEELLEQAESDEIAIIVSFMTFMEVHYITLQKCDEMETEERIQLMNSLPVLRVDSTENLGILASHFKANHHLSVADAWIAALAKERNATLVHKDPEFDQVEAEINVMKLPYKSIA